MTVLWDCAESADMSEQQRRHVKHCNYFPLNFYGPGNLTD